MTWLETIRDSVARGFRDYADKLDDDISIGEGVEIYSWASLVERNETHEVDIFLHSHVLIGNDSGDNEFLLRRDGSPVVYCCDAGSLGADEPDEIHPDVAVWLADGCPLPDEGPERLLPLSGPIWLIQAPPDGLKGMFELRKILEQSWPASVLRSMMADLPHLLVENGHPYRTMRILEDQPEYLACLASGDSASALASLEAGVQ